MVPNDRKNKNDRIHNKKIIPYIYTIILNGYIYLYYNAVIGTLYYYYTLSTIVLQFNLCNMCIHRHMLLPDNILKHVSIVEAYNIGVFKEILQRAMKHYTRVILVRYRSRTWYMYTIYIYTHTYIICIFYVRSLHYIIVVEHINTRQLGCPIGSYSKYCFSLPRVSICLLQ
jgi:hypothetical protein